MTVPNRSTLALLVGGLLVVLAFRFGLGGPDPVPAPLGQLGQVDRTESSASPTLEGRASADPVEPARLAAGGPTTGPLEPGRVPAWSPPPHSGEARAWSGRVRDPQGNPVTGAEVRFEPRLDPMGGPVPGGRTLTDRDGQFFLRVPANDSGWTVLVEAEGFGLHATFAPDEVEASTSAGPTPPSDERVLDTIVLGPPVRLHGLVSHRGSVPRGTWRLEVRVPIRGVRATHRRTIDLDPVTGGFDWRGAPRRSFDVRVLDPVGMVRHDRLWRQRRHPFLRIDIEDEPIPSLRLVPVETLRLRRKPAAGSLRLLDVDGRVVEPLPGSGYRYANLGPGPFTAVLDDPRFRAWRSEPLSRDAGRVEVPLDGASALHLALVDDRGVPIRTGIEVVASAKSSGRVVLVHPHETLGPDHRLPVPALAWMHLEVMAEGHVGTVQHVQTLRAGSLRRERISLTRLGAVAGVVLDSNGDPVVGAPVTLARPRAYGLAGVPEDWPLREGTVETRGSPRTTTTDAEGRFRFDRAGTDVYFVSTEGAGTGVLRTRPFEVPPGETKEAHALVLPRSWPLDLRVFGDAPGHWVGTALVLGPPHRSMTREERDLMRFVPFDQDFERLVLPLDLHGHAAGRAAAGRYQVWLARLVDGVAAGRGRHLGVIEVTAEGTTDWEHDLGPFVPRRLETLVRRDGLPLENAQVVLQGLWYGQETADSIVAVTDANGRATFGPVLGGRWKTHVYRPGGGIYVQPGGLVIGKGLPTLTILDAD